MLSGCYTYIPTIEEVAQQFSDDWEIQLPEDAKLLYYLHCSDWTEGEYYYVIGFEETPIELIEDFSYGSDNSIIGVFNELLPHMSEEEKTEIPTEYIPDGEAEYCCKSIRNSHDDSLYLLYNPECLTLYVLLYVM